MDHPQRLLHPNRSDRKTRREIEREASTVGSPANAAKVVLGYSRSFASVNKTSLVPSVRLYAHERVIGVEVIDVFASDHLMLDECRRRHLPASEDIEGELDQPVAVPLREIADRRDQRRL